MRTLFWILLYIGASISAALDGDMSGLAKIGKFLFYAVCIFLGLRLMTSFWFMVFLAIFCFGAAIYAFYEKYFKK